jgi:signal transduction histidine kinase/Flp pilus assembly protein TadD
MLYFCADKTKKKMKTSYVFCLLLLLFTTACRQTPSNQPENNSQSVFDSLIIEAKKTLNYAPDSSLLIYRELSSQTSQLSDNAKINFGIGKAYNIKGVYDSANYYLYDALRKAEQLNDAILQSDIFGELGILQFHLKNSDEAIEFYRKSFDLAQKQGDSVKMANQVNNIGNVYMSLDNDFKSAIPYFEQCVEISVKIGYSHAAEVAGINLAMIYNATNEHDKAINEAQRLIDLYGPNIYADFTIAVAYHQKGNHTEALRLYHDLLKKPLNTKEFELVILNDIASLYQSIGDLNNSIDYFEKYHAIKDSIHNLQTENEVNDLKISYETEKKDMTITVLEKDNRLMTRLSISSIAVLVLALATFFFLWRWIVQKKYLADQKVKQLEQEKQLIATQAVLDGETIERTRLARDLHDGLGGMLSAVKYNLNDMMKGVILENADVTCFNKALNMLDDSISELRRVAHHMMPESLSRYGLKPAISDFCASIPVAEFNYYGDETRVDAKLEVMIYRIIHELVNNALKHSGASHILVQIVQDSDSISLIVQDNGCGFDISTESYHPYPSKGGESKGMGLQNIRSRVESYKGVILIDSRKGEGTEINVEFNLDFHE